MEFTNKKFNVCIILDYIMCTILFLLAIEKGGFFKSNVILFNLIVNIITIIYIAISNIKGNTVKEKNNLGILVLLLSVSYMLPVILRNYSSLNDSIFEMIRYFNVYLIYCIVSRSQNKLVYKNSIIIVAVILVILGVDQIASGYMSKILKLFNSGYLTTNNLDRMSSTIQYANVFALICLVAYVLLLDNVYKKKWKYYIHNISQMILLSGILLSGSRTTLLIILTIIIYNIIKYGLIKKNTTYNRNFINNILINILLTFTYVTVLDKFIANSSFMVYIITALFYILNVLLFYILKKYFSNFIFNIIKKRWSKIIGIVFVIIIVILIVNIKTNIKLDSSSNKSFITRNIYNVDRVNSSILEIQVDELYEDTRYEIEVFQVDYANNFYLIQKMYYYSSTTGDFSIDIIPIDNLKYINININCTKGSMKVNNILLNGKQYGMDYLLLPSSMVYRIIDGLHGSNSTNYRVIYQKDALKISSSSIKNFLFGIGGEGFRNEYNYFKSIDYNSTEVHNIYIQILLESGIIGLIVFICIVIYILVRKKSTTEKIALICIFVHGIFDLDFSYMIVLAIFGILLGIAEPKENKCNRNLSQEFLNNIKCILVTSFFVITTVILLMSNIATNIKVYNVYDTNTVYGIVDNIQNCEKLVNFDMFEPKYRIKVNEAYHIYLNMLKSHGNYYIEENMYNNILTNLSVNLDYLQQNESNNTSYLISVSDQYFNNLSYLVNFNYSNNLDAGYEYYLNIIYTNMKKIYNCNDKSLRNKVENMCNSYIDVLSNLDNNIANKYIKLLESITRL